MKLKKYVKWTGKTCAETNNPQNDNLHMILGMLTEVGELADVFKKELAYGKEPDWVNVSEEIGDVMFYIASFCRMNALNLGEILSMNREKLEMRYSDGVFSKERALKRDLDLERRILESH